MPIPAKNKRILVPTDSAIKKESNNMLSWLVTHNQLSISRGLVER